MFPHVWFFFFFLYLFFLIPPLCGRAAWAGSSDAKRCRGASVALGRLRAHRGSAAHPYLRLLLHWKGKTHRHTQGLRLCSIKLKFPHLKVEFLS